MTLNYLAPQAFFGDAKIQMPFIDFYGSAINSLPQVYRNAVNFTQIIRTISTQKQYIYDVIISLVNVINMNNTLNGNEYSQPNGVYLRILATMFGINDQHAENDILRELKKKILQINSRGLPLDFFKMFEVYGISGYFNSSGVNEIGNATIVLNVPIQDLPASNPNPIKLFEESIAKIKSAGVKVKVNFVNRPNFRLGSINRQLPSGDLGYGILQADNETTINGGYQGTI